KFTNIDVVYNGVKSAAWGLPVAPTSPAIFTIDENGVGQAAAINQGHAVNGPANPAARGTVIQVYATGLGQTSPPGITGGFAKSDVNLPALTGARDGRWD